MTAQSEWSLSMASKMAARASVTVILLILLCEHANAARRFFRASAAPSALEVDSMADKVIPQQLSCYHHDGYMSAVTPAPAPPAQIAINLTRTPTYKANRVRRECAATVITNGERYFQKLAHAFESATQTIILSGWVFHPDVQLIRTNESVACMKLLAQGQNVTCEDHSIIRYFRDAHKRGVGIWVLLYENVGALAHLASGSARKALDRMAGGLDNGVQFCRYRPALMKAHHQKFVIIDGKVAFIGGLDVSFNRYDSDQHKIDDVRRTEFHNIRKYLAADSNELRLPTGDVDEIEVTFPEYPWQDIQLVLTGPAVSNLISRFKENFVSNMETKCSFCGPSASEQRQDKATDLDVCMPLVTPSSTFSGPNSVTLLRSFLEIQNDDPEAVVAADCQIAASNVDFPHASDDTGKVSSIYEATLQAIEQAKYFIHIENQYFITNFGCAEGSFIKNHVGIALLERVRRAIESNSSFDVTIVLPYLPDSDWLIAPTFCSLSTDQWSLKVVFAQMFPGVKFDRYFHIFSMRSWAMKTASYAVAQNIYVHTKAIVVDDEIAIIGTANINDRSLRGTRDSEVAYIVSDGASDPRALYHGVANPTAKLFATNLRYRLMQLYLPSLTAGELADYHIAVRRLENVARANDDIYHTVFGYNATRLTSGSYTVDFSEKLADCVLPIVQCNLLQNIQGLIVSAPLTGYDAEPESFCRPGFIQRALVRRIGTLL